MQREALYTIFNIHPKLLFFSFTYPARPGRPVLSNLNLELEPGRVTAIVGDSGAGKSTLASLLMRYKHIFTINLIFLTKVVRPDVRRCLCGRLQPARAGPPHLPQVYCSGESESSPLQLLHRREYRVRRGGRHRDGGR